MGGTMSDEQFTMLRKYLFTFMVFQSMTLGVVFSIAIRMPL
jgi:hypothetical protein